MQPPPVFSLIHPSPHSVFSKKKFLSPKSSKLFSLFFLSPASFCQKSSQLSTTGRTKKERREAAPRTGPPRGSAVAPRRVEKPRQSRSPSSFSLVGRSVGRRCADAERPWGGSGAVRHVGECDGVVATPDDPGAPPERRVGGGCLGGRSGDGSHLPPSAADFSVSSFIFST